MIDNPELKSYNVFKSKEELDKYTNQFSDRFTNGEIQFIDGKMYMWSGSEWDEIAAQYDNDGISISMYDLNEQIISQLPDYTDAQIEESKQVVNDFYNRAKSKYYMLLCKEASYYTLFTNTFDYDNEFSNLGDAVITCAADLGKIKSVETIGDAEVEIWVYDTIAMVMYCLHLFDYQQGVVSFGR